MSDYTAKSYEARHPAAELWRETLARIPTLFGRLVYLAALRDAGGGYAHPALSHMLGRENADRTLRHSHHQIFAQWLALGLEEQKSDLGDFLHEFHAPREALHYRELVPAGARDAERQLYLTDLETLLELLKFEHGGVSPAPEA
ncbi:MAG: hypothetical protein LAQ30_08855 [Acidobacteriia bacterium]|nr:hypothetical protein [Terriglobia bacterium]